MRSISKYVKRMEDKEEKDAKVRIEAATDLLKVKGLPQHFGDKAHAALCELYTKTKEYKEAHGHCEYVIQHKKEMGESVDVSEAVCNEATALLAEDKYDEAIRLLSDALKEDQRNQKVTVVVESDTIVAREAERGGDGAEAKQGEGLLQDSGSEERCQPEGDQEGVSQAGAEVASRQACGSGSGV